ncbi:MAG: hypothetical protein HUJ26_05885 [Planctomycetaceae bacterium]|nr:hypothetical protein [Planctomycetaceae bacterium]
MHKSPLSSLRILSLLVLGMVCLGLKSSPAQEQDGVTLETILESSRKYETKYDQILKNHIATLHSEAAEEDPDDPDNVTKLHDWSMEIIKTELHFRARSLSDLQPRGNKPPEQKQMVLARNPVYALWIEGPIRDDLMPLYQVKRIEHPPGRGLLWLEKTLTDNLKKCGATTLPMTDLPSLLSHPNFSTVAIHTKGDIVELIFEFEQEDDDQKFSGLTGGTLYFIPIEGYWCLKRARLQTTFSDKPCRMIIENRLATADGFAVPFVRKSTVLYRGVSMNGWEIHALELEPKPQEISFEEFFLTSYGLEEPEFDDD